MTEKCNRNYETNMNRSISDGYSVFNSEKKHMIIYSIILGISVLLVTSDLTERCILFIILLIRFGMEMINTSIEWTNDANKCDYDIKIKYAKDVMASASHLSLIVFIVMYFAILYKNYEKLFYKYHLINNNNNIIGVYAIIVFASVLWWSYTKFYRSKFKNPKKDDPLTRFTIHLPSWFKCWIPSVSIRENINCEDERISIMSIGHLISYIIIGSLFPREYFTVLVISIINEYYEYMTYQRCKWYTDPIINMIGYGIGTFIHTICVKRSFNTAIFSKYITLLTMILAYTLYDIPNYGGI